MPRNAIIVGMPRSGTSMAAAIFARKSYYLGEIESDFLREGDDHNPFGYFEADDLTESNKQVFRKAGYAPATTWHAEPITPDRAARIARESPAEAHRRLVERYDSRSPWVWKDPRLCFTLAYWWKLMDPARTGVLLLHRDPMEIYQSFLRVGWCPSGDGSPRERILRSVEQHAKAAAEAVRSLAIPHVALDYADFRAHPEESARRLREFFDVEISIEDLNVRAELNHSSWRGRFSAVLRNGLRRLPRRPVRALERLVPRPLLAALFPERKYTDDRAAPSRRKGR